MRRLAVLLVVLLAGCHPRVHPPASLEPLAQEGEVFVYLAPFPGDAARLAFSLAAVEAIRSDGAVEPLTLALPDVGAETMRAQRLLGWGRLSPGAYGGLQIRLTRATLATDEGVADLLASKDPVRLDVPFPVARGRAVVVQLALRPGQASAREFAFSAGFTGAPLRPEDTVVQVADYCSATDVAALFVVDRRARQVTAAIPTGREPGGVALDVASGRGYVALGGEDQVQVLDLSTGEELRRIALRTGDAPRELALTVDGRVLVTVNPGSNSVAFVDPLAGVAVDRVLVGDEPRALLLDRQGRRAYVLNRRGSSVTVLDVVNRTVLATVTTDPEPLRAQLNRDGSRLYVVHRGSPWMAVFTVPDLTPLPRVFVGLGAETLRVDPRTDLIYVGRADEGRLQVFDPASSLAVGSVDVPGPVSYLAIDDVENALIAVIPSLRQLAFVDLVTRRVRSTVDVGRGPFWVAPAAERF
jgi:YVTN family beta-propeller protein